MSKKPKSVLVYVHGTNGSGKSTLARLLVAAAGGSIGSDNHAQDGQKAFSTYTNEGVVFLGKYDNACGGVDGFSPYAAIHDVLDHHFGHDDAIRVFGEGLLTPGLETCRVMAERFDRHLFIALNTPEDRCVQHVLRRRATVGNAKPFDPSNLQKKLRTVHSWANRLEDAGLSVKRLSWREAYLASTSLLGLDNINHHL